MAELNKALEAESGSDDVSAAIDAADKAGDLPSAEPEKKDAPAEGDMKEPAALSDTDENGTKKSEVEMLMEKADHEEQM